MSVQNIVCFAIAAATASSAFATFTQVCPPPAGEKSHKQILEQLIGGTFTASGVDYSNGSVVARRVTDYGTSGQLSLLGSATSNDDQTFSGGPISARAKVAFAAHDSTFGWINDVSGQSHAFQPLLNTHDLTTEVTFTGSNSFRFALNNNTQNALFTSRTADNAAADFGNAKDHMVTYKLSGPGIAANTWLLFWEDLRGLGDCDYNDAVIKITVVPAPSATALATLGGLLVAKRRRR
jgi:hypothetical protein